MLEIGCACGPNRVLGYTYSVTLPAVVRFHTNYFCRLQYADPVTPCEADLFDFEREFSLNQPARMEERQGQERSLEQRQRDVYETHRHRTFAVAFYMTGSELEAEDVLTDTFVKAFDAVSEPNGQQVDAAMVGELRERLPIDEVPDAAVVASGSLGGRNVKRTDIEEALKELPPNERLVFLLRDVEGYTAEKVAGLLGVPAQQVERTTFAARIRMRNALMLAGAANVRAA